MPQALVLGPQLFTIYINDLDTEIEGSIAKFADDTKIGGTISCNEEIRTLQIDIDKLEEWAKMGQMEFNVDKCEVMHFGRQNGTVTYYLMGRDFGVLWCRGIWVSSFMSHRKLACRYSR